jgi:hypothetical protein
MRSNRKTERGLIVSADQVAVTDVESVKPSSLKTVPEAADSVSCVFAPDRTSSDDNLVLIELDRTSIPAQLAQESVASAPEELALVGNSPFPEESKESVADEPGESRDWFGPTDLSPDQSELVESGASLPQDANVFGDAIAVDERMPEPASQPPVVLPLDGQHSTLGHVLRALLDENGYDTGLDRLGAALAQNQNATKQRFFYEEILKRNPESFEAAMIEVASPADAIRGFLSSEEFVIRHNKLLLDEFADLKRELIIHVPKSGGTTLMNSYQRHAAYASLADEHYVLANCTDRLDYYRGRVEDLTRPGVTSVVITGHVKAPFIFENGLKRGNDEIFSILRDPVDSSVSFVNYILTELKSGSAHRENESRRVLLGLGPDEPIEGPEMVQRLARAIVENLMPSQNLCSMFSRYDKFDDAANMIAILGVRFIPVDKLDQFMTEKGLPFERRENVSSRFLEFSDIARSTRMLIYEKIGEDLKLYSWLERNVSAQSGATFEVN